MIDPKKQAIATMDEMYKRHRPKNFKGVIGQPETVKLLLEWNKSRRFPHTILLSGPSGCGKTTIARILKERLECADHDFIEINCGKDRGIDMVRQIGQRMGLAPIRGKARIWLIDECHQMTGEAQDAALKLFEDTPKHVYFLLATTDPSKLKRTIVTRATELKLQALSASAMQTLLQGVVAKEGSSLSDEVVERLIEAAEGSARKALVILDQIIHLESDDERLDGINNSDSKKQAIDLARCLINPRSTWKDVAKILKAIEEDPEGIRRAVLGYARNVLLGGGATAQRAFLVIDVLRDNYFDSGKAGLAASCWELIHAGKTR